MNKRSLLPVLSTALLAPAFLAGQVYAEEATTPAESSAVVVTPATSATPAPVESPAVPETSETSEAVAPAETPVAPTTEAASPTSAESAEAKEAPVESPEQEANSPSSCS